MPLFKSTNHVRRNAAGRSSVLNRPRNLEGGDRRDRRSCIVSLMAVIAGGCGLEIGLELETEAPETGQPAVSIETKVHRTTLPYQGTPDTGSREKQPPDPTTSPMTPTPKVNLPQPDRTHTSSSPPSASPVPTGTATKSKGTPPTQVSATPIETNLGTPVIHFRIDNNNSKVLQAKARRSGAIKFP